LALLADLGELGGSFFRMASQPDGVSGSSLRSEPGVGGVRRLGKPVRSVIHFQNVVN
jgi:hypothetical protein